MSTYVFTGPTLSPADASAELDAIYMPPVAQGDVYRVCRKRPIAIGIIDGYFRSTFLSPYGEFAGFASMVAGSVLCRELGL